MVYGVGGRSDEGIYEWLSIFSKWTSVWGARVFYAEDMKRCRNVYANNIYILYIHVCVCVCVCVYVCV
jgi:hypothetical protein